MDRLDFRNNHPEEIKQIFQEYNFSQKKIKNFIKSFRISSINNIDELKGIRDLKKIKEFLPLTFLRTENIFKDDSKNEKFVFSTHDGYKIESVFMPGKSSSICVSTQAGCRMKCAFCKTGLGGLNRNLSASEILDQVRIIFQSRIMPSRIDNIAFMGMGEPLDNIDNCRIAFEWLISRWSYQLSREKITFSTIVPKYFTKFLEWNRLPNLAISLHSLKHDLRKKMIPSSPYGFDEIKEFIIKYNIKTGKQATIEYCLFEGINDTDKHALELAEYLKNIKCKVNLLNYNTIVGLDFKPVPIEKLIHFKEILKKNNIPVIYRKSLGTGINAGCGQLG